jgi:purine-binding chemotaxis protein CheW
VTQRSELDTLASLVGRESGVEVREEHAPLRVQMDGEGSARVRVLLMRVGRRRWGILADEVREILRAARVRPLPGAPAIVEGMLDVRGEVLPVFDLARSLEGSPSRLSPDHHFVLVRGPRGRRCLLHVDRVEDLVELDARSIEDAGDTPRAASVTGWVRTGDDLLLITDSAGFLSDLEREELAQALEAVR